MSDVDCVSLGHINLRGDCRDPRFLDGVSAAIGQPLPLRANTISFATHRIYWLGPDEWQIVSDINVVDTLVRDLCRELHGEHVSANNLSGGQVAYHLSGANAVEKLAKGCTLDLHPSIFQMGDCAQSNLAKANMLLGCIDKAPVYEIIVRRSFSEYVLRWLRQT